LRSTLSMRAGAKEPRYVPLTLIDRLVGMSAVPAVLGYNWLVRRNKTLSLAHAGAVKS